MKQAYEKLSRIRQTAHHAANASRESISPPGSDDLVHIGYSGTTGESINEATGMPYEIQGSVEGKRIGYKSCENTALELIRHLAFEENIDPEMILGLCFDFENNKFSYEREPWPEKFVINIGLKALSEYKKEIVKYLRAGNSAVSIIGPPVKEYGMGVERLEKQGFVGIYRI